MRINNSQLNYFTGDTIFQGGISALSAAYFVNTVFSTTSALSVINTGIGPALFVSQTPGNYDIASFYDRDGIEVLHIGNAFNGVSGRIGINESFPNMELTVRGQMSATGAITVSGGNSDQWNSNFTTTGNNSANWSSVYTSSRTYSANYDSVYTSMRSNSANYDSVYTSMRSNSANYDSVYTSMRSNSANYDSVYASLRPVSANYDSVYTSVKAGSGKYESVYTSFNSNSGRYDSNWTTVNTNSATWSAGGGGGDAAVNTLVHNNSGNWDGVYTTTGSNSANWSSVYTSFNTNSGKYDSNWTTTNTNSANWITQGTTQTYLSTNNVLLNGATVTGDLSSSGSLISVALSSRFINLVHSPANDGAYPYIRIGETDTGGFSGFRVTYDENLNKIQLVTDFGSVSLTAASIDRNANVTGPLFPYMVTMTPTITTNLVNNQNTIHYPPSLSGVIDASEITNRFIPGKGYMVARVHAETPVNNANNKRIRLEFANNPSFTSNTIIINTSDVSFLSLCTQRDGIFGNDSIITFQSSIQSAQDGNKTAVLTKYSYVAGDPIYWRWGFGLAIGTDVYAICAAYIRISPY